MAKKSTSMSSHRDEQTQESERLEREYELLQHVFSDQLLHPSIPPLGKHFAAADIGTGTGAWLNDLARTFPRPASSRVRLVGFDISSSKFPPVNEERVDLVVHDITKRFSEEYHGVFDVVHLRLLVYVIREEDIVRVVENVTELLRPGGYLQWQDTDLNEIWATPASSTVSQAIKVVNLERTARELSLFMPEAIVRALRALTLPSQIPILDLPSCSRKVLRIIAIETISTAKKSTTPELESAKQDISFGELLILLHAATLRKQSGKEYGRLEERLRKLSVTGSHRLDTKFTWIVAQKTTFVVDQV